MLGLLLSFISTYALVVPQIQSILIPSPPRIAVSITFDDGPHVLYTSEILDILKEKKVQATFFVIGNRIQGKEYLLKRSSREGHTIGNHSYSHILFSKIPPEKIFTEVIFTNIKIFTAIGKYPKFFRFPYGGENAFIKIVHSGPIVGWNVDAYDWKAKDPKKLAQKIIEQSKDGSIILLHDIKSDTVSALPIIIDGLRSKDFTIVPLHILLSGKIKPQGGIIYKSRYNSSYTKKIPMKDAIKTFSRKNVTLPQKQPSIITTISTW